MTAGACGEVRQFPQSSIEIASLAYDKPKPSRGGRGQVTLRGRTMSTFIKLLRDDRGAAAAEYALILAIVGAAIALAAVLLGGSIANAMGDARNCIDRPPTTTGGTC